jgi:hypothetical protein
MVALPTATTDRIGSLVACSSVPALGFMAFADADSIATILAAGVSGAVVLTVASVAGVLTDGDVVSPDAAASLMAVVSRAARLAVVSRAARLAVGSEAALAVFMAAEGSTVEAALTAAVSTGVDTGNYAEF